jgi:hypothetical protein
VLLLFYALQAANDMSWGYQQQQPELLDCWHGKVLARSDVGLGAALDALSIMRQLNDGTRMQPHALSQLVQQADRSLASYARELQEASSGVNWETVRLYFLLKHFLFNVHVVRNMSSDAPLVQAALQPLRTMFML